MGSREKKFILNSWLSICQQAVAVVCGLLLPQMILLKFGSTINGTIASITQFLSFITLLQGGIGTVARLAFYKPLANNDSNGISIAYKTVEEFYKKFAIVFSIYLVVLSLVYPLFVKTGYSYVYVASLTLIIGIASVFEYFFGQASQMLLFSAQLNYIYSSLQIACTIISTIIGIVLLKAGFSIHIVKLGSTVVFVIRPIVLYLFVNSRFGIQKRVVANKTLLNQRTSAFIRHIAFYIHTSTDIMVLTIITNVLQVSVYSVHRYVVSSLGGVVQAVLGNTEAIYGELFAKERKDELHKLVPVYDLISKILTCSVFFTCIILISRFVNLYTRNVHDVNYYQPIFATVLVLAEMVYCMGMTYQSVFIAAGHIKNTEWMAIGHAAINLIISILLVNIIGITGVAIGTLVSSVFKTIVNILYMKRKVLEISTAFIVKSYTVNLLVGSLVTILFCSLWYVPLSTYLEFFLYAPIVFLFTIIAYIFANYVVFKREMKQIYELVIKRIIRRFL